VNRYKLIEAFFKVFLWIVVIIVYIMYIAGAFNYLTDSLRTFVISAELSATVILLWFMPSAMAERRLVKGVKYLDKDNDKAARYFKEYLGSKTLTDSDRNNALRILGIAHHKRGDDESAIRCLNQALQGYDKDNELKVEILGAMGIIHSELGEYQKAVEYFDKTFEIIFAISKAHIDKESMIQVANTYIKVNKKEQAVMIYDRLLMIQGFKRDKRVEELLGI